MKYIKPHYPRFLDKKNELVLIADKDTLSLLLRLDSQIDNEYWIFYEKYKTTSLNEIGRIRTNILTN